jgi:RNA polymerase sigma factor (sigma-70 family)
MSDKTETMSKIYEKYNKRIFNFLYKYTQNFETASDLMQESFLSFFQNYQTANLNEEQSLKLLFRISRNNSINYSKKLSTKNENVVYLDNYRKEGTSFEKHEELKDLEIKLQECLNLLPEEQKTAMILKNMNDMTLEQISEIMEVSISSIHRLVVKGTARLLELALSKGITP